jgi:hypothetical protein
MRGQSIYFPCLRLRSRDMELQLQESYRDSLLVYCLRRNGKASTLVVHEEAGPGSGWADAGRFPMWSGWKAWLGGFSSCRT